MRVPSYMPNSKSPAYCWVIAFAGFLGLFASLGLGRFSLGMMLPGMGSGLGLSYSQMGVISTVNFCGYLGAVLFCGWLNAVLGARLLICSALLLVGGSMVLIGRTSSLPLIILLYGLTGVGSALANVPVMALISTWFTSSRRGRAAGVCVMGNGLGILVSARVVPLLGESGADWRLSWLVLGGAVLVITLFCAALIRNNPGEGCREVRADRVAEPRTVQQLLSGEQRKLILQSALIYFLFGFTYVIYITFMVTSLVQERGFTEQVAGGIWAWVGFISLVSGPLFGSLSDRFGRKQVLMLVFTIQAVAYLLVALKWPVVSIYCSVMLYGLVAFSVPTVIAALVGDYTGSQGAAAAFGFITFTFGIGQIAGPALAGVLAESTGSFSLSFFMASGFACCAMIVSSVLPSPARNES